MTDPMSRLSAALVDRYRIDRPLGEGGMAMVYQADDLKHDRKVAIKVLKPELSAVIGAERFLAEIRTTANLQHPHILPLFDSGEADGFLYYVMPLLEGHSLRDRLVDERQLPVTEALAIAKVVAGALDYAHRQGVIHRDIKPANILLHDGQPVVADFGIALAVSAAGGGRMTETGLSLGTPSYMSPEQATADHDPGPQSDIYSLGCVLYEMLTGEPPYTGPSAQAILGKIIMGNPTLPTEHRPAVPVHVEAALLHALEKLPADRFQSAAAFSEALEDTGLRHPRQGVAAGARADRAWLSQRASQVTMAVAVLAIAWAGYSTFTRPEPGPRPVVRDQLGDLGADYPMFLALSPDGRSLAWKALNTQRYYLRRLDAEEVLPLAPRQFGAVVGFSPDSRWILASLGSQGMVRVAAADGRVSRVLGDAEEPSGAWPLDWTEDGILYRSRSSDSIMLLESVGGTPLRIAADLGRESSYGTALIPGGRYLVYHTGAPSEESEIRVYDTRTGDRRTLVSHGMSPSFVPPDHLFFVTSNRTLHAAAFDPATATLRGEPYPVEDSVFFREGNVIQVAYDVSESGDAVFLIGGVDVLSVPEQMVRVDQDGTETPLSVPPGQIWGPRLSPDGRTLAYIRDDRIHLFDPILSLDEPIPGESDAADGFWVWDPAGERLAYVASGTEGRELMVYRVGDDEPVRIRLSVQYDWFEPVAWTPDGESLVLNVEHQEDGDWDEDVAIARLGPDTAVVDPYLPGAWRDRGGALAPGGDWFVYSSDERGGRHLYARSFPEPGPAIQITPPDLPEARRLRGRPAWGPDGEVIYWRTDSAMMATEVSLGATLEVGETRQIVTGDFSGFDLAPDGSFIVSRPVSDEDDAAEVPAPRLVHVSNWLDHVRALRDGGS